MKHLVLITFIATLLLSCSQKNNALIGEWKLIEEKIDIGNGLGQFLKTNNSKTVTFLSDGTVKSSGSLCHMVGFNHKSESGVYSIKNKTILSNPCSEIGEVNYELKKEALIILYRCNEPCGEKYVKIN